MAELKQKEIREQLRGMTDRGDRFAGFGELPHDVDDFRIEPQILGRAPAGNRERIVLTRIGVFERCVQREQMPRLFGVGLIPFEIMNGGLDPVAGLLVRAHRVDYMSDCLQRLKRHHRFVILGEIAGEKQNLLCRHRMPPVGQGNTAMLDCVGQSTAQALTEPRRPPPAVRVDLSRMKPLSGRQRQQRMMSAFSSERPLRAVHIHT